MRKSVLVALGALVAAAHREAGNPKDLQSRNGEYGMVPQSDAQAAWYEQAERVEQYLLETQDPTDVRINDEGKTDAISGVSVTVESFFTLAQEALEGARR
jgi:major membrane immunogen (membrane-anchored lipoprotein)